MKASEARQMAIEKAITNSAYNSIYDSIIQSITKLVSERECYHTTILAEIPEAVIKMLLDDGYEVIPDLSSKQPFYTIKW